MCEQVDSLYPKYVMKELASPVCDECPQSQPDNKYCSLFNNVINLSSA